MIDGKTAEKFAEYMKKYTDLYEYLAQVVRRYIPNSQPLIVDLGAGPGLLSLEIHKKIPKAVIVGIDPLVKMLKLADENAKDARFKQLSIMAGLSEKIPLKNNTVDVVVSRFSLPYWKQPAGSFSEISRVLKPGGRVVLEALNREFSVWKLFIIKIHMLLNLAGGDVARYHLDAYKNAYTMDQVKTFLADVGFVIIETEGTKKDWKFIVVAEKKS